MSKTDWPRLAATLTSALTILAALPYSMPPELTAIIPAQAKSWVFMGGLIATTLLRAFASIKSKPPTQ